MHRIVSVSTDGVYTNKKNRQNAPLTAIIPHPMHVLLSKTKSLLQNSFNVFQFCFPSHQLHRRPRSVLELRPRPARRADVPGTIRHILDLDSRQRGRTPMVLRMVHDGPRAGPRPRRTRLVLLLLLLLCSTRVPHLRVRHRGVHGPGLGLQLAQGAGQVLGVHLLVGRVLVAHLPAHGRGRRRRDEEELVALRQVQVAVGGVEVGVLAEVDADAAAEDGLAVEDLADGDGVVDAVEGDDDAAEGLERGEGVDGGVLVDGAGDVLEYGGGEDIEGLEVGDQEGVGGRRGVREGREVGEVERHAGGVAFGGRGGRRG